MGHMVRCAVLLCLAMSSEVINQSLVRVLPARSELLVSGGPKRATIAYLKPQSRKVVLPPRSLKAVACSSKHLSHSVLSGESPSLHLTDKSNGTRKKLCVMSPGRHELMRRRFSQMFRYDPWRQGRDGRPVARKPPKSRNKPERIIISPTLPMQGYQTHPTVSRYTPSRVTAATKNLSYDPNLGYEPYWPGGDWVFNKDKNDTKMCGASCPTVYERYGQLCARSHKFQHKTFKTFCAMKNEDCHGKEGWVLLYRGECRTNPATYPSKMPDIWSRASFYFSRLANTTSTTRPTKYQNRYRDPGK